MTDFPTSGSLLVICTQVCMRRRRSRFRHRYLTFLLLYRTITSWIMQRERDVFKLETPRRIGWTSDSSAHRSKEYGWYSCSINMIPDAPGGEGSGGNSPKRSCIVNEMRGENAEGNYPPSLSHTKISGAHAWRSSITPIDQLLRRPGRFLMSCAKTQWSESR